MSMLEFLLGLHLCCVSLSFPENLWFYSFIQFNIILCFNESLKYWHVLVITKALPSPSPKPQTVDIAPEIIKEGFQQGRNWNHLGQWLSTRGQFCPSGPFGHVWSHLGVPHWARVMWVSSAEATDTAPTSYNAQHGSTAENTLARNVKSAEVEKPCWSTLFWAQCFEMAYPVSPAPCFWQGTQISMQTQDSF